MINVRILLNLIIILNVSLFTLKQERNLWAFGHRSLLRSKPCLAKIYYMAFNV